VQQSGGLPLGVCDNERRGGKGLLCLEGLLLSKAMEQGFKAMKISLQSVSNSKTDVTVNLSSFAELSLWKQQKKLSKRCG